MDMYQNNNELSGFGIKSNNIRKGGRKVQWIFLMYKWYQIKLDIKTIVVIKAKRQKGTHTGGDNTLYIGTILLLAKGCHK